VLIGVRKAVTRRCGKARLKDHHGQHCHLWLLEPFQVDVTEWSAEAACSRAEVDAQIDPADMIGKVRTCQSGVALLYLQSIVVVLAYSVWGATAAAAATATEAAAAA
jgi:hypothetical protein